MRIESADAYEQKHGGRGIRAAGFWILRAAAVTMVAIISLHYALRRLFQEIAGTAFGANIVDAPRHPRKVRDESSLDCWEEPNGAFIMVSGAPANEWG
jgi:hypothetical protein